MKVLGNKKENKKLSQAIKQYAAAISIDVELKTAKASIDKLKEIDKGSDEDRTIIGAALMMRAVVLYCRALDAGSHRGHIDLREAYGVEQKKIHRDIDALRNTSLAHFGVGTGAYGADWSRERLYYEITNTENRLGSAISNQNYSAKAVMDLNHLLSVAIPFVETKIEKRGHDLHLLLGDLPLKNPDLAAMLLECPFDPSDVYSGPALAAFNSGALNAPMEIYEPRPDIEEY